MNTRHRQARSAATRVPLVIALVAAVATGTVLVVQNLADARGCGDRDGIRLPVAADPAIAPAIREAADGWIQTTAPAVDGRCIAVDVSAVPTAEVASQIAVAAGGFLDVATPAPLRGETPAVWVPESSYWIGRLRTVSRNLFLTEPVSLATSPIVLAASPAAVSLLGPGPVTPTDLRAPVLAAIAQQEPPPVRLAEPRRDAAGLVGAGWLRQATVTAEEELPNLVATFRGMGQAAPSAASLLPDFDALNRAGAQRVLLAPVSQQAVTAHSQAVGATSVATVPVAEAPALDYPYAVLSSAPQTIQTAAAMLRAALGSDPASFARHGFNPAVTTPAPIGTSEQLATVLRIWTSATRDARVLSVVNVNASMAEPMGTVRRVDVFRATAEQGMTMFTPNSELGHWEYADGWREGVPIATLTEPQKQRIATALASIELKPTTESALFETLLAAYREMKAGYAQGRSNTLIMWTDAGNQQPGGLTLEETLRELERLADLTRPIRVILLGLGPDADMAQLSAIARVTGGGAFHLENPEEIALIFLRALLT